jgi:hypothetical protein
MAEEENEEMAEAPFIEAAPEIEETSAQRDERLQREDYAKRLELAIAEREDILRRNGVIGPKETLTMDTEAAIRQRCCPS